MARKTADDVYKVVMEIQTTLAARAHLDEEIISIKHVIDGNGDGKPGLKTRIALSDYRDQ